MIPMITETDPISCLLNERNTALNQIDVLVKRIAELEADKLRDEARIAAHKNGLISRDARIAELEAEKRVLVDTYEAGLLADKERIAELDKVIAALKEVARKPVWPVDEDYPKQGQVVLCCYVGVYSRRVADYWVDAGGNGHFSSAAEGSQPVTHWMPLPEPPEAQEDVCQ